MRYVDFVPDKAYRVSSGDNGTLAKGDIIWVDSVSLALNNATAKGWLEKEECSNDVFDGVVIEATPDYIVKNSRNGSSCCCPV